jgi:hypothetical protein
MGRLSEPSTWAALAAVLAALAPLFPPAAPFLTAGAVGTGAIGVWMRERSAK